MPWDEACSLENSRVGFGTAQLANGIGCIACNCMRKCKCPRSRRRGGASWPPRPPPRERGRQ
eukprot:scaffold323242_cov33-Tisochrysis_lutea.AAC.1